MIVEAEIQDSAAVEDDDDLIHIACEFCDEDRALCGKDVTGRSWVDWSDYPDDCVVCMDLAEPHVETCEGWRR